MTLSTLAESLSRCCCLHFQEGTGTLEGPKTGLVRILSLLSAQPCLVSHPASKGGKSVTPSECPASPNPRNLKHLNKAVLSYGESRAFQGSFLEMNYWNGNFILLELTCCGKAHEGICFTPEF